MKRIVGLPGETVAFVDGRVLINGEVLDEPYEKSSCDWNLPPVKLGPDEYFVVGDNRTMPWADHTFGEAHAQPHRWQSPLMKIVFRILLLAALAALGIWLWTVLFPSPEKVICKRLTELARTVSSSANESDLTRLAAARNVGEFFATNVELNVNLPELGQRIPWIAKKSPRRP